MLERAPGAGASLVQFTVNTPQIQRNTPVTYNNTKSVTFRTSLTGMSFLLHNTIVTIYSQVVHQPSSGIRRSGMGVSLLSPLRPVLGNGESLIELLGNALTFERVLQHPAPSHLRTTDRPRMRYTTFQQLPSSTMMSRAT